MDIEQVDDVSVETIELYSVSLERNVRIDFYQPANGSQEVELLLFNDGHELAAMGIAEILEGMYAEGQLRPLLLAAIHAGDNRLQEYGMAVSPNVDGLGSRAGLYEHFVINELLPFVYSRFQHVTVRSASFAGFSLGALSALDIVWNNPNVFAKAGVFSGSLWWRSVDKNDKSYDNNLHRMMHMQVRNSEIRDGMKFFFQCGELDEWEDRNKNGVTDSIDDTIDLMRELVKKGYREGRDFVYQQLPDGRHEPAAWAKALPTFLRWGWSVSRRLQQN